MSSIDARQQFLSDLFHRSYRVPPFQRNYSWNADENAQQLISDIEYIDENNENHFFGSMIFQPSEDNSQIYEVLDGQQRLSTILIMISALRDVLCLYASKDMLLSDSLKETISIVESDFLFKNDLDRNINLRLTLNSRDNEYFAKILKERSQDVLEKEPIKSARKSHKLIYGVYVYFFKYFQRKFKENANIDDYARSFLKLIKGNFSYIQIIVNDELDANRIFESINSKGVRLSGADLIKNFLFTELNKSGKDKSKEKLIDDMIEEWDDISDYKEMDLVKFIRHYWLSKIDNNITKLKIYEKVKERILNKQESITNFIRGLLDEAGVYVNLISPRDDFWIDDPSSKIVLENLSALGTEQSLVLMLALYDRFYKKGDYKSFRAGVEMIEILTFKRSTICHIDPKPLESKYSSLAIKIRSGQAGIQDLQQGLLEEIPSDEIFLNNFLQFSPNHALAKYVLSKIYDKSMRDVKSKKDLHLEHIIPKKYYTNEYWKSIEANLEATTGDSLNDIKDFIGNMTLLIGKDNTRISNGGFDLKIKDAYSKSTFPANQKLALMTKFSILDVKNRQKELGIEALDIWKI